MGGGASTDASVKRQRAKRRYRRLKKEHYRLNEQLKRRQGVDDYGVKCFFDDNGEPFYFSEDGYVFYLDETRTPYYKDVDGNICYNDDEENVYYVDQNGDQYYFDDEGMKYYKEEDGTHYYLDNEKQKYYYNEKGQPYYIDEFGEIFYKDGTGREYYVDKEGKSLYKDHKGRKYYMHQGEKVVLNSERDDEINQEKKEEAEKDELEKFPILMRNRVTSHKYVKKGEKQIRVSGVVIKTSTPRSWKQGRQYPSEQEEEEDVELPPELLGGTESINAESVIPQSTVSTFDDESDIIVPSPVPNIDNTELADLYEMEVVDFDALKIAQKRADHHLLRNLLDEELEKRKLPARQMAKKVGEFPVRIKDDKMKCSITGCEFLGDGSLVISDYNNRKVKLFNTELEFVTAMKLDFFPQALCARPKQFEIYITFKSTVFNAIQVISVDDERFKLLRKIHLSGIGYGVSGNNEGLAVVVRMYEGWQIHLLSLQGKILRKIMHEIEEQDLFASPHHVLVTKELKIFVSDRGTNQIHGFNSYGDVESTAEGIRDPKGLCSNKKGSLFITNPSGMHQISEGGHKVGTVINRNQIGFPPTNICYDEEDRLVIMTGDADIMAAFQISDQSGYYYNLKQPIKPSITNKPPSHIKSPASTIVNAPSVILSQQPSQIQSSVPPFIYTPSFPGLSAN